MDKTSELLPCPFCGSNKSMLIDVAGGFIARCGEFCCAFGFISYEDKSEAIRKWNTRVHPSAQEEKESSKADDDLIERNNK